MAVGPYSLMKCIACKSDLRDGATVCAECGQFQGRWKNSLRYFGTLAGLLTVIVGGAVFSIERAPTVWRTIFWKDDVEVLTFATVLKTAIANVGDGSVFVESITVKSKLSPAIMILNATIEPGEVFLENNVDRDFSRVSGVSSKDWGQLRRSTCYETAHFDRDNAFIREARILHPNAEEELGTGTIQFVSLKTGEKLEKSIDTTSVFIVYEGCKLPPISSEN